MKWFLAALTVGGAVWCSQYFHLGTLATCVCAMVPAGLVLTKLK